MTNLSERTIIFFGAILCTLALFVPFRFGSDWFIWGPLFDAGHYPLFLVATLTVARAAKYFPQAVPASLSNPYLLASLFAVGAELVQPWFGRSASFKDIQNGLLGVAAAGMVLEAKVLEASLRVKFATAVSLALLCIPLLWPLTHSWDTLKWRKQAFPLLADFTDVEEKLLWAAIRPEENRSLLSAELSFISDSSLHGGAALSVKTIGGNWAGVEYAAGGLSWGNYSKLSIVLYNPSAEQFTLNVRIDDFEECKLFSDRFNKSVLLHPGRNQIEIPTLDIKNAPASRTLELERIKRLMLFTDKNDKSRQFQIEFATLR